METAQAVLLLLHPTEGSAITQYAITLMLCLECLGLCAQVYGKASSTCCLPADRAVAAHERARGCRYDRKGDCPAVTSPLQQHDGSDEVCWAVKQSVMKLACIYLFVFNWPRSRQNTSTNDAVQNLGHIRLVGAGAGTLAGTPISLFT